MSQESQKRPGKNRRTNKPWSGLRSEILSSPTSSSYGPSTRLEGHTANQPLNVPFLTPVSMPSSFTFHPQCVCPVLIQILPMLSEIRVVLTQRHLDTNGLLCQTPNVSSLNQ